MRPSLADVGLTNRTLPIAVTTKGNQRMKQFTLTLVFLCMFISFTPFAGSARAAPDDPTIVGGNPVPDPNPFVWQVSLQQEGQHNCGGSVIDGQWILTAAHCLVQEAQSGAIANLCSSAYLAYLQENVRVVVGVRALSATTAGNTFAVAGCVAHPGYDPDALVNDIAVIQLATPIANADAYLVPLLLNGDERILATPGAWTTVSGWGNMVPQNNQSSPDVLMALDLPLVDQAACQSAWGAAGMTILDSMVCAGFVEGGKSSCQGDSGGALVIDDGFGSFVQQGIVSFGPEVCNAGGVPSVYTRVSAYIEWLQQTTGLDLTTYRAPDLVVARLERTATGNLAVVVSNQGTARIALDQGFWVDLYIAPQWLPEQVNETWNFVGNFGAVWGVDENGFVLLPGEEITLELGNHIYWPTLSNLPWVQRGDEYFLDIGPETPLYIQVDSANADTTYGAILETHEIFGAAYNNIAGPFFLAEQPTLRASTILPHHLYLPLAVDGRQSNWAQPFTTPSTTAPTTAVENSPLPARPFTLGEK